ncbi:hypothetical protein Tco_0170192 [Tanacetum coccineum]
MATMAENVVATGKENGEMLLDSINNGPFQFKEITVPTTKTTVERKCLQELKDLTSKEKTRKSYDIKATNIIILGLPSDIYTLVNHHKIARDIWNRIKELMEVTKLIKQERELKLYDEFDRFTFEKGESLHSYYLRYAKLINNMNIINMTMTPIQINKKFVNHLQPEWSRKLFKMAELQFRMCKDDSLRVMGLTQERYYNCKAQEAGVILQEEQQDFLADGLEDLDSVCDDLQLYRTSIFKEHNSWGYNSINWSSYWGRLLLGVSGEVIKHPGSDQPGQRFWEKIERDKSPSRVRPSSQLKFYGSFGLQVHLGFHLLMMVLGASESSPCGCVVKPSARIPQAPERYGFYIDAEEHELGDHGEPPNYRAALSDLESENWLEAINA